MKPLSAFDPNHPRCWCPRYGKAFSEAMDAKKLSPQEIATKLGIDVSNVLGYRRGFQRNRDNLTPAIQKLLGVVLPYNEKRPSTLKKEAASPMLPLDDPRLTHLAALALGMGYQASFTPL